MDGNGQGIRGDNPIDRSVLKLCRQVPDDIVIGVNFNFIGTLNEIGQRWVKLPKLLYQVNIHVGLQDEFPV